MYDLSIIIPAYNEEKRISSTLISFNNYLSQTNYNYELIVADDGSTDGTIQLIKTLQKEITALKLVQCETNKGKGQAVRTGMLAAKGKIRLFSDADGSTPIEELEPVLFPIQYENAQISIGSRYLEDSQIQKSQPFYRRAWSRMANKIVQRILLPGIVDPNCGFKAFTSKATIEIFSQCTVNEWSFDLEALAIARKLDLKIAEVPVRWANDEDTKGKLSDLPQEIRNLFIIRRRLQILNL